MIVALDATMVNGAGAIVTENIWEPGGETASPVEETRLVSAGGQPGQRRAGCLPGADA
jgi:hypothetical protein